jgi:hypothetical protein
MRGQRIFIASGQAIRKHDPSELNGAHKKTI